MSTHTSTIWKSAIIPIIALGLSIGSSVFISGESSGKHSEKISVLEAKAEKQESYAERLARIETKIDNIETLLQEVRNKIK